MSLLSHRPPGPQAIVNSANETSDMAFNNVTSVPSSSGRQAIFTIEFDAVFTLEGLSLFDVPVDDELEEFTASIADSIQKISDPLRSNVEVEVTTVGGVDDGRRLRALQGTPEPSIEVGIQDVATEDCYRTDCEDPTVANAILVGYKDALAKSINNGDLTERIRAEASTRGYPRSTGLQRLLNRATWLVSVLKS